MIQIPHDSHGNVPPGTYEIDEPIILDSAALRGHGQVIIRPRVNVALGVYSTIRLHGFGSVVSGIRIEGGWQGIETNNAAKTALARIEDVVITGTSAGAIRTNDCQDVVIDRALVLGGYDNGLQIWGGGITVRNSAFLGTFGNKAIDNSVGHGTPHDILIQHCTVVTQEYGVGLTAWTARRDLQLVNCLIIAHPPGPGSQGYAINAPNGGTFFGNVVCGTAPDRSWVAKVAGPAVLRRPAWDVKSFADIAPASNESPQCGAGSSRVTLRFDALGQRRATGRVVSGAVA